MLGKHWANKGNKRSLYCSILRNFSKCFLNFGDYKYTSGHLIQIWQIHCLVHSVCYNKYHRLDSLYTEIYSLQFWWLQVWDQGNTIAEFWWKLSFGMQIFHPVFTWWRGLGISILFYESINFIHASFGFMTQDPSKGHTS